MSFLKKLFGGKNKGDNDQEVTQAPGQTSEVSNEQQLGASGLEKEEKEGSWLSRAFSGIKDMGKAMGAGGKEGAMMGGAIGAVPGGLVGAGIGAGAGKAVGGDATMGAKVAGGILALPGAIIGGLLGGLAGVTKGAIDQLTYDEAELLAATADIPGYHVILEQLAHTYAYGKGDMKTLDNWGYELAGEYEDKNSGFRVIAVAPKSDKCLDPDGKQLKPVVAFRGTANAGGALDDLNGAGIGTFQFSRNEKEIEQTISKAKGASAPDVTGHSLGGALAQMCAARFGGMVGDIITFQAAGIEGEEAQRIDGAEHEATHYRAGGDLVHSGGEAFANGKVVQFDSKGLDTALSHMTFPLAQLNALRGKNDTDAPHVEGARGSADTWEIDKRGEYHNGHWAESSVQEESNLHSVKKYEDANDSGQSGLVEALGGHDMAVSMAAKAGALSDDMGITSRQEGYAHAWRAIRGVAMNIQHESDIPKVRDQMIDLVIKFSVPPQDHAKFISQGEAAMLDALAAQGIG